MFFLGPHWFSADHGAIRLISASNRAIICSALGKLTGHDHSLRQIPLAPSFVVSIVGSLRLAFSTHGTPFWSASPATLRRTTRAPLTRGRPNSLALFSYQTDGRGSDARTLYIGRRAPTAPVRMGQTEHHQKQHQPRLRPAADQLTRPHLSNAA